MKTATRKSSKANLHTPSSQNCWRRSGLARDFEKMEATVYQQNTVAPEGITVMQPARRLKPRRLPTYWPVNRAWSKIPRQTKSSPIAKICAPKFRLNSRGSSKIHSKITRTRQPMQPWPQSPPADSWGTDRCPSSSNKAAKRTARIQKRPPWRSRFHHPQ